MLEFDIDSQPDDAVLRYTAARKTMRSGREIRLSSLTVDIHSHVAVPSASAIVQPHLGAETIPLIQFSSKETITVNIQQDRDRHTRMTGFDNGLKGHLDDLDEIGIDVQLIMPPPALLHSAD
jgi:aminocarboxymuconate-semialdehyde decarboxylase